MFNLGMIDGVLILAYHRVAGLPDDARTTPVEDFHRQVRDLAARGFTSVTASEAVDARFRSSRRRLVAITFDDGYVETIRYAVPILGRYGFVATIFMVTDWAGTNQMVAGLRRTFLEWQQLRDLAESGYEIASHTATHTSLDRLPEEEVRVELSRSRDALRHHLGTRPRGFCYPRGDLTSRTPKWVAEAGYDYAVVTPRRRLSQQTPFTARRVGIYAHTSPRQFAFKTSAFGRFVIERGYVAQAKRVTTRSRPRPSTRH